VPVINAGTRIQSPSQISVEPASGSYNQMQMQLSSDAHIPDGLIAAMTLLSEKPRQGVPSRNPAPNLGIDELNSTVAIGLRAGLALESVRSRYTGKERDAESGNDYFGARYYASNMGRWMSPDWNAQAEPVPYAELDDPQSLNLYAYALNSPLVIADADGHSTDIYKPDLHNHGEPHIDRQDSKGKLVGRYRPDGTPIEHKGKTPPPIPKADEGKFGEAAEKVRRRIEAQQQEQNLEHNPPPVPKPPLPDGLKPCVYPCVQVLPPFYDPDGHHPFKPFPFPPIPPYPYPGPNPIPPPFPPVPFPIPLPFTYLGGSPTQLNQLHE